MSKLRPARPGAKVIARLPMMTVSHAIGDREVLHMPAPRAALRHAMPVVFEGVIAPIAIFYVALVIAGFRGALLAALGWSVAALLRRIARGDRVSTVLFLDVLLLTLRTVVSFITKSGSVLLATDGLEHARRLRPDWLGNHPSAVHPTLRA